MSRRKSETTARLNEQDYPQIVELTLPSGGFRTRSDDMLAFHRERGIQIHRGQGRNDEGNSMCGTALRTRHMPKHSACRLEASGWLQSHHHQIESSCGETAKE